MFQFCDKAINLDLAVELLYEIRILRDGRLYKKKKTHLQMYVTTLHYHIQTLNSSVLIKILTVF